MGPAAPAAATVAAPVAPVAATWAAPAARRKRQAAPAVPAAPAVAAVPEVTTVAAPAAVLNCVCPNAAATTPAAVAAVGKLLLQPLLSLLLRQLLNNFQRLRYVFSIKYFSYPYLISTLRQKLGQKTEEQKQMLYTQYL